MKKSIYLASLADGYDTPLFVSDSLGEMASYLGCTKGCLSSRISKFQSGRLKPTKIFVRKETQ